MSCGRALRAALLGCCWALGCGPASPEASTCAPGEDCGCQPGEPDCNPCQPGYRPALVGSGCVATCNTPESDCGEHGTCHESASGASCSCEPGYTGPSCSSCENGLKLDGDGKCFGELSAPSLLSLSSVDGEVTLGALLPPNWGFVPLAAVDSEVTDVAYSASSRLVYLLRAGQLESLDLASGETQAITDEGASLGSALCLDQAGQRALTASDEAIYQVELDGGEVTELAAFGAQALEYDAARGVLIGVDAEGATFELSGSEPALVGSAPELSQLALAFDDVAGRAYFLGGEPETADTKLLRYCSEALAVFGAIPAWQRQLVEQLEPDEAEPLHLDYTEADSALVALDLSGAGLNSLEVDAQHPDSALCIVDEGDSTDELQIELSESTRAAFVLVAAPRRSVHLDLRALPEEGASGSLIVHTDEGLTLAGPGEAVGEYGTRVWKTLGLTSLADFDTPPAARLVLMDWASQASISLELPHRLAGSALAWVGEAP